MQLSYDRPNGVSYFFSRTLPSGKAYSTPTAIYSLRLVNPDWFGRSVINVRRSGDDAEKEFSASDIELGLMGEWITSGGLAARDAFVADWYDQSGNGNHARQITAASQPKIWDSVTGLVTEGGRPALDFDGVDDFMGSTITGMQNFTDLSIFAIIIPDNASAPDTFTQIVFGYADSGSNDVNKGLSCGVSTGVVSQETISLFFSNNSIDAGRLGSTTYSHTAGEQLLHSQFYLSSGTSLYKNSSQITLDLSSIITTSSDISPSNADIASDAFHISSTNGVLVSPSQKVQEIIVYSTDQSANREAIEDNINDYYDIY